VPYSLCRDGQHQHQLLAKKRKEIDDVPPIEVDVLPLSMDVIVDDDGGGGVQLSQLSNTTSADGAGAVAGSVEDPTAGTEYTATAASACTGNSAASVGVVLDFLLIGTEETAAAAELVRHPTPIPRKRSKSNNGTKHKKHPAISDADLDKQVNKVRDASGGWNIVDSSLRHTQTQFDINYDNEDDANKVVKERTKYFTFPVPCGRSSPWWDGFELFIPVKHPKLFEEHVMCLECSTFKNNPDAGIVKIGISQSTSNLRSHKKHHHSAEYEAITKGLNKTTKKSDGEGLVTKSILNMPGFTAKVKVKDAKLLYRTAATTLAIEEGIPFRMFSQPSFRRLFNPLNAESNKIVNLSRNDVRDSVLEMGGFAVEATKREIRNHQISWTTDHWTGADKYTYTTVTAHWINKLTWKLHSACLDFKVFEGSTTGERIYEDIISVLHKYSCDGDGATQDTIVFDTIGITDTTGNMGKLGRYLRENGKEHGYCTDHNLHLVAKLAFDREIVFVCVIFFHSF